VARTNGVLDDRRLKQAVKEVLAEKFAQDREWLHGVVAEVLEDMAMAEAIRQGRKSKFVRRDQVFHILEGAE
jgi:hypothetical protein